jgi:hypothetical protein
MEEIIEERLRDYVLVNKKTWEALNNGKITIFEAQYTRKKKVIKAIASDIKSKLKLIPKFSYGKKITSVKLYQGNKSIKDLTIDELDEMVNG